MGVHWKTKQTQRNLLGKSTLAHQSSNISPVVQCIGAELVCPTGEQLVNGGFETGDFTGWTATGGWQVVSFDKHSGTYSAYTNSDGVLEQDFSEPIHVECFTVFEVYVAGTFGGGCPPLRGRMYIDILYSDLTYTRIDWQNPSGGWHLINLLDYVETGKKVKGIRFSWVANDVLVDDYSAVC